LLQDAGGLGSFGLQLTLVGLLLPVVEVGLGHVALASITEPSGHVCVDGCGGGGVGHVALASITEPSGHVCVDGCGGGELLLSLGGLLLLLSLGGWLLSLGGDD